MARLTRRGFGVGLTASALAQGAPARAQQSETWFKAQTPRFAVFYDGSQSRVRSLIGELEAFDALLARMLDAPNPAPPFPLEIYLFRGADLFDDAFGTRSSDARGFYLPRPEIIAAIARYVDVYGLTAQDILFHEYAHHFQLAHFAAGYPTWFVEGFAEFVSTIRFEDRKTIIGQSSTARASWLASQSWTPIDRLLRGDSRAFRTEDDVASFYAESWLLTHYILLTGERKPQFLAYLRAWRAGAEPVAAFEQGFGMPATSVQSQLRQYFQHNPPAIELTRPAAIEHSEITITPLAPSAAQLLGLSLRVRRGVSDTEAPALIERVRHLVGSTPTDEFALKTLASAEAKYGDPAHARELLQRQLADHANDVEAHYLFGLTYYQQAQKASHADKPALFASARRSFAHAHNLDGNYLPPLYRYAQTYDGTAMDDATADNVLNILLLAHQLAPQIADINIRAGQMLIDRNRPEEAVIMLRAVVYNPHVAGEEATRAQTLLTRAQQAANHSQPSASPPSSPTPSPPR